MNIQENKQLKDLNTFQLESVARYYAEIETKDDLVSAFDWAETNGQKVFVLGGGSNVVCPDGGVDGLVIRLVNNDIKVMQDRVEAGAGTSLANLNAQIIRNELSGLEWSSGIPRVTLGGAIRGNAGAFGVSMEDIVETIEVYDKLDKRFETLSRNMTKFAYRTSIIKEKARYVVWSATLRLKKSTREDIQAKVEKSINFRLDKYPRLPSLGSVFENIDPIELEKANKELFDRELKEKIGREGKVAAGLLIDMVAMKGVRVGGMKVSLEHANHIVNTGNAKAEDLVILVSRIKQAVRDRFKIELREEISYLGF